MCSNPKASAVAALGAIRPLLSTFMSFENVPADTQATVLAAYDAATTDVANWVPGSTAQTVAQAIQALDDVFNTLPVPDAEKALAGVIDAAILGVLAIIEGNNTTDKNEQASIVAHAVTAINAKAPGSFHYHKGVFAAFEAGPAKQIHDAWNKKVDDYVKIDPKYAALKIA